MEEIAKFPAIKVVASEYGNAEVAKAMEVMENFMTAYPSLKGVFVVTDVMAIGAGQAVEAAGKRDRIKILGFDGQPNAAEAILAGSIDGTVAQKPVHMGKLTVDQIVKYFKGEKFERVTDTGCDIVDASNAKEYLNWH
jgi:ribose transport system substrate-binding protein